jgi:hypothetical protein
MSDDGQTTVSSFLVPMLERMKADEKEHERKMQEDPAYRAACERRWAERRSFEEEERRYAEGQKRAAVATARQEKGIPEKFFAYLDAWRVGATEAPASVQIAHGWVSRFLRENGEWCFLFLAGPVGVGKSCAAAWFLDSPRTFTEPHPFGGPAKTTIREALGRFITADAVAKASNYDGEFWDALRDTPRLVLDDLGIERLDDKGWGLANLSGLLCHRHAHRLPTVITLNLTRRTFEDRYASSDGGRLRDRLRESAWFVELTGPSLRRALSIAATPSVPAGPRNP